MLEGGNAVKVVERGEFQTNERVFRDSHVGPVAILTYRRMDRGRIVWIMSYYCNPLLQLII